MAKVFRIHNGTDGTGWFNSTSITFDRLNEIITEGKEIANSIPSPFARIDLFKSAFRWVSVNDIHGRTYNHKLVSDALDVGQLFFYYKKHKEKVAIASWEPTKGFERMKKSSVKNHQGLSQTLNVFWDQDSVKDSGITLFNFERLKKFYFLINRTNNRVIGGTSPASIFFAVNDLQIATHNLNIVCGNDVLFDNKYAALNQRDSAYIIYLFALAKQNNFALYFPEVNSYLDVVKALLPTDLQEKVSSLEANSLLQYESCPVLDNENEKCEVLGIPLKLEKFDAKDIEKDSDFVIKSELHFDGLKPLVLPTDKFTQQWVYTTKGIFWNENTVVPKCNPNNDRLPVQENSYPWHSIHDFLEEKIFKLPYSIDKDSFVTCGATSILVPLKPLFFKYFKADNVSKYLKIDELSAGGIMVDLKIPVRGGDIKYKKTYLPEDIKTMEIHTAIIPFIKSNDGFRFDYNIGVLDDRKEKHNAVEILCYQHGKLIAPKYSTIRNPGISDLKSSYHNFNASFDVIQIKCDQVSGFIVPKLPAYHGDSEVWFAIDFGTTNTHIEYKVQEQTQFPFDILPNQPILKSLIDNDDKSKSTDIEVIIERENTFNIESMPFILNAVAEVQFPLRTAMVINKNFDFTEKLKLFHDYNNFFFYEKREIESSGYLTAHRQLKWSNYFDIEDEHKVGGYILNLLRLVYYKTLQLGGNPRNTRIIWFYPVSMDNAEFGVYQKLWINIYKDVFKATDTNNLVGIPESIAPYLYHRSQITGLTLSIDIGGGSSDIAIFEEKEEKNMPPKLISSIKFAGNAIFGDGYPDGANRNDTDNNGFVAAFKNEVEILLKKQTLHPFSLIFNSIVDIHKDSSDFSSFLFSLESQEKSFSYTTLLSRHRKLKLTFFVFYGALAYYSAKLMKKSQIDIPENVIFSGTASKTASILDSNKNLPHLSSFFKFIFKKVYCTDEIADINMEISEFPKEVTCRGALKGQLDKSILSSVIKFWIGGGDQQNQWGKVLDKNSDVKHTPKYGDIQSSGINEIKKSILEFYQILDEFKESIRFESNFAIDNDAYDIFKKMRQRGIEAYLMRGLRAYYRNDDSHIEETLFFYPLIGILNKLAYDLAIKDKQAN